MNILLIGYRRDTLDYYKNIVSESFSDCEVATCRPGLELLDLTAKFTPSLVIILAGRDHFECLDSVDHLLGARPEPHIIFIAEEGEQIMLERALAAGVDDFIAGEPTEGELILRVKRGLSNASPGEPRPGLAAVTSGEKSRSGRPFPAAVKKIVGNTVYALLLLFMAVAVFLLIQGHLTGEAPSLFGYRIYTVLSGSMSPAFEQGSIILVRSTDPEAIIDGDIITFRSSSSEMLTTHRVVGVHKDEGIQFTTRGDANNVDDPRPVPAKNLVGRVCGSLPLLGYLICFGRSRVGLVTLIFLPATAVIIYELCSIYRHWGNGEEEGNLAA